MWDLTLMADVNYTLYEKLSFALSIFLVNVSHPQKNADFSHLLKKCLVEYFIFSSMIFFVM